MSLSLPFSQVMLKRQIQHNEEAEKNDPVQVRLQLCFYLFLIPCTFSSEQPTIKTQEYENH